MDDRRKDDKHYAEFVGEISQWKEESIAWRKDTDKKLTEILKFMEEIQTPRRVIIWTVRAVIVGAIGSVATGVASFLKGHIHFQ